MTKRVQNKIEIHAIRKDQLDPDRIASFVVAFARFWVERDRAQRPAVEAQAGEQPTTGRPS